MNNAFPHKQMKTNLHMHIVCQREKQYLFGSTVCSSEGKKNAFSNRKSIKTRKHFKYQNDNDITTFFELFLVNTVVTLHEYGSPSVPTID